MLSGAICCSVVEQIVTVIADASRMIAGSQACLKLADSKSAAEQRDTSSSLQSKPAVGDGQVRSLQQKQQDWSQNASEQSSG